MVYTFYISQAFIQRVEQRKLLLDLAVSFYTHTKEVIHIDTHFVTTQSEVILLTVAGLPLFFSSSSQRGWMDSRNSSPQMSSSAQTLWRLFRLS